VALRAWLEDLISSPRPQLIAEEAKLDRECLGNRLAADLGCKYCNITMPWVERAKHGITSDYDRSPETRKSAYAIFEAFMFQEIQKIRGETANILIICGSYHVNGLAKLFSAAGDDVETKDIFEMEWYRGRPIENSAGVTGFYKELLERS